MNLEFFCTKRQISDLDNTETYRSYNHSFNFTEYYKRTRCINNIKFVYVIEAHCYYHGLFFKRDNFYSYDNIYISLGPILEKLNEIYHNSTYESWSEATKNCPTILDLFTFQYKRTIRIDHHPDYTDMIHGDSENFIRAKEFYFLNYHDSKKIKHRVPVSDKSYEEEAFTALKNTASKILDELKLFDFNAIILKEKKN